MERIDTAEAQLLRRTSDRAPTLAGYFNPPFMWSTKRRSGGRFFSSVILTELATLSSYCLDVNDFWQRGQDDAED